MPSRSRPILADQKIHPAAAATGRESPIIQPKANFICNQLRPSSGAVKDARLQTLCTQPVRTALPPRPGIRSCPRTQNANPGSIGRGDALGVGFPSIRSGSLERRVTPATINFAAPRSEAIHRVTQNLRLLYHWMRVHLAQTEMFVRSGEATVTALTELLEFERFWRKCVYYHHQNILPKRLQLLQWL